MVGCFCNLHKSKLSHAITIHDTKIKMKAMFSLVNAYLYCSDIVLLAVKNLDNSLMLQSHLFSKKALVLSSS